MVFGEVVLLLIFLTVFAFLLVQFYLILFKSYAPVLLTRPRVVSRILDELKLKGNETVYELGCGPAGFLRAASLNYPEAKLFGVEINFFPYLLARIQDSLTQNNITIKNENLFKTDLKDADIVYCYLNDATMKKLAEKFQRELKPGSRVVSYKFQVPGRQAGSMIEAGKSREKVYFYDY